MAAFGHRETFSRQELYDFFIRFEPDLKASTFRWRVHELKQQHIISVVSRQQFSLKNKDNFHSHLNKEDFNIYNQVAKVFGDIKVCIWNTVVLNDFMLHQPAHYLRLLEIEADGLRPVFNYLQGVKTLSYNVFLNPNEREIELYLSNRELPLIIRPLISRAPLNKQGKVQTVTLEKILVDLFCDQDFFSAYAGAEFSHIVKNAYDNYVIDFTKLFQYASRRSKATEMKEFFRLYTDIPKHILE